MARRLPEERPRHFPVPPLARWQRKAKPDSNLQPIWELARKLAASIPAEELRRLPTDGASQLDQYLYGAPKRRR